MLLIYCSVRLHVTSVQRRSAGSGVADCDPFQRYCMFPEPATPALFHPNFRGVPRGLDYRGCGSDERSPFVELISN